MDTSNSSMSLFFIVYRPFHYSCVLLLSLTFSALFSVQIHCLNQKADFHVNCMSAQRLKLFLVFAAFYTSPHNLQKSLLFVFTSAQYYFCRVLLLRFCHIAEGLHRFHVCRFSDITSLHSLSPVIFSYTVCPHGFFYISFSYGFIAMQIAFIKFVPLGFPSPLAAT